VEEERRLFFVGITRARRELYLSRCCVRSFRGQQQATLPSRFLAELPEEPMVLHDRSGVRSWDSRSKLGGPWLPARRPEPRPAPTAREFRLMTAADLAGSRGPEGTAAPEGPVDLDAFRPGVSVLHPEYGLGRVVTVDGAGPNRKGRVRFAVGPERTFVLAKSPLRPVSRSIPEGQPPQRPGGDRQA
jgi:DNA helicase-2/ATP-dependent DNA helicase PcrA